MTETYLISLVYLKMCNYDYARSPETGNQMVNKILVGGKGCSTVDDTLFSRRLEIDVDNNLWFKGANMYRRISFTVRHKTESTNK